MAITHTINNSWAAAYGASGGYNGAVLSGTITTSGIAESNISVPLAAAATDTPIIYQIPTFSMLLVSFYLIVSCACTVKVYQGATLVNTLTLVANSPVLWTSGSGDPPIDVTAADITQLKYTTGASDTGTLDCRALFIEAVA